MDANDAKITLGMNIQMAPGWFKLLSFPIKFPMGWFCFERSMRTMRTGMEMKPKIATWSL